MKRPRTLVVALFAVSLGACSLHAGDLRIPLPKKSKYTPVQKLNRDGVTAVEHHQYEKARKLFYKAYLIDPNDPFTLNNLGYLAELEGNADRAQRFYQLSSEQNSEAIVDKASNDQYEGKPVSTVAGNAEDKGIKINRLNSEAIALLNKDRAPEADLILQKALQLDSRNPFTLNNLGFAKEKEGELDAAYQFYSAAASTNSRETIEVTPFKDWRGRRISEVASESAKKLNRRMRDGDDLESRVAILNLRGVSAMNRNDRRAARDFIQQAFKLDPANAFTLNNMGYLAELDGDQETADYYYDRAREANASGARITLATRKDVEGKRIGELATNTDALVLSRIENNRMLRQQAGGPVVLRRRDNTAVVEPLNPVNPPGQVRVSDANGNLLIPVAPGTTTSGSGSSGVVSSDKMIMPLPENQQPVTVHQGQTDNGLMMPLPEDQQPGAKPANPDVHQGESDGGLMMPLPEDQQPGAQPAQPQPGAVGQPAENPGVTTPVQPSAPDNTNPTTSTPPANPAPQVTPPAETTAPAQTQPAPNNQPAPTNQAPAQQPPAQQEKPGLLLPPPDSQQPQTQQPPPQTTPQSSTPQPKPKKISDSDPNPTTPNTTTPNGVKKISDQN